MRSGIPFDQIPNLTQRQIQLFYREAIRTQNHHQARMIGAVNVGMAGGKDAQKIVDRLTR